MAKKKKASSGGATQRTKSTDSKRQLAATETATRVDESNDGLVVVGIGASAGGLDAFKQLFSVMPTDTRMAFVLIQHLDPTHESLTAELLNHQTAMSVVQVTDQMRVEPNHVYVIPPNRYLTISGMSLHLTEPVHERGVRVPIDFFFRSLADDQQQRSIAVVLTGTGSDGALGAREIKAAGGMVMVQQPETAPYDGMPRSAIATGVVDYVLPLDRMPDALLGYIDHWYVSGGESPAASPDTSPDHLTTIIGLLRARLKYDFSCYKKGTLTRRVQRRLGLRRIADMGAYAELLRNDSDEVTALYKDLLISVTNFFREPEAWQELAKRVIEPLVAAIGPVGGDTSKLSDGLPANSIRVWAPGCATGEEPYSIAMVLAEKLHEADLGVGVNVFASDIDTDALAFARAGVYAESIAADVTPERLRHYFVKGEHTYRINKDIRDTVVFAEQNIISDPPFSKLDLISCRNLLIYLEPEVQSKILSMFHFALREGGYLFLGNAETVGQQQNLFRPVSRRWRLFQRISLTQPARVEVPIRPADPLRRSVPVTAEIPDRHTRQLSALASQAILQRFAPASVMVNHKGEILYLTGPVDEYLQLPTGEPSLDLFHTCRAGLRTRLRAALNQVVRDGKPVVLEDVRVKRDQTYFPIRVSVEPILNASQPDDLVLIAFDEATAEKRVRLVYVEPPPVRLTDSPTTTEEYESVIRHLEGELINAREDLQTTVEELETSNEEFKAANEEVTSINEELQSTNEELETSKEELQSMNEELHTVNNQLEAKVGELESTTDDLVNLLASIDQATLFLDRGLRIRRFTPATTRLYHVIDADIGRPLSDIARNFADDELLVDAAAVLQRLTPIEKEILDDQGGWYARRIVPYRTEDDRIDGVVVTFVDISAQKRAADATDEARRFAEAIVETVREPLIVLDNLFRVQSANGSFYETFGVARQRTEGRLFFDLGNKQWDIPQLRRLLEQVLPRDEHVVDYEVTSEFDLIGKRTMLLNARTIKFGGHQHEQILLSVGDITDRKRDEADLKSINRSLEQQVAVRVQELRRLEQALAESAEAERRSFGRDMHDTLGQQISAIGMLAASIRDEYADHAPPSATELLEKLEANVEKAQRQARSLISGLMPVDLMGGGLPVALERLAAETTETFRIACESSVDAEELPDDSFIATQLFLIVREATTNAAKHAGASHISIELSNSHGIRVSVADDGVGIPPNDEETSGMGLRIMSYRASLIGGELSIESPARWWNIGKLSDTGISPDWRVRWGISGRISVPAPWQPKLDLSGFKMPKTEIKASDQTPSSETNSTQVMIVDDHELLRDGLRRLIARQPNLEVCAEAGDEREARRCFRKYLPDLVVVDLSLKESSGLDLIKWILKQRSRTKVIVSTMHDERDYGERAMRAGAAGYVNKQEPARTILTGIARVMEGKLFFSDALTARLMQRAVTGDASSEKSLVAILSDRELDIFTLIGQGLSTDQMATRLHLSPNTIGTYRERLKTKLDLGSSPELTRMATLWIANQE